MRTIYKYKLDVCDQQTVSVPQDFILLKIGVQKDSICMWGECESDMPMRTMDIRCFGTGHRIPDIPLRYLGSAITEDGFFVWHFYEKL